MSNKKIHIIHLIHTIAYGGVETALINWLRKIDDRFIVHLVCFANPGNTEQPFVEAAAREGLHLEKIPWGKHKPVISAVVHLRRLIKKHRIDILHTHGYYADLVGYVTQITIKVKTITTSYVWADLDWKRNILQAISKFCIKHFDLVSAHCEDTYNKMLSFNLDKKKLRLLICGFECELKKYSIEERQKKRKELGVQDNQIILANIARFYPEKAQHSLLRCFKKIHALHSNVRLWMLGVGPLENELQTYCTELGIDDYVEFKGFANNLNELMPLIDIQVHPSWMEGVALAILTGMAAGMPIVASDVGGLKEVLSHKNNCLLAPPGDEDKFTKNVVTFIEDPELALSYGQTAKHFIEHDYSLSFAVERLEETYDELITM